MELLDPVVLARIQFAANITFHILFPDDQHWLGMVFAVLQNTLCRHTAIPLDGCLSVLDQDIRTDFCIRCRKRHHHEFSVWYQLAGIHEHRRERGRPVARV
jgi:hypothetical protein